MWFFNIESIAFSFWDYQVSYIELIGTLFGLISVYLATKANIWTWPTGIVNEFFLFILFYQVGLYADMTLQVYFFAVTLLGWYNWKARKSTIKISFLTTRQQLLIPLGLALGTLAFGFLFRNIHQLLPSYFSKPAAYPFVDSFVMVASIIATVLLARKKMENWYLWMAVDVVCVVLLYHKKIYFLSAEYAVFLGLVVFGFINWKRRLNHA